jgi:predicted transcriptional regulator
MATSQQLIMKEEKEQEEGISKTTIRLPDEMLRELKHLAIDDRKTLTELVTEALTDYLKKRKKLEQNK